MFDVERREALLATLIGWASDDEDVVAAALVGSVARGEADRWSDIDLALALRPGVEPLDAADAWTERVPGIADALDLRSGPALYRVLLLEDSLQVDLSFWPAGTLRSTGEPLRVLFGDVQPAAAPEAPDPVALIRWAWLVALHARSAIARGRNWQALEMLGDLRKQLVALACLRHDLLPFQGRGVDRLPEAERAALLRTVPAIVDGPALATAFAAALAVLRSEIVHVNPALATRLDPILAELAGGSAATAP